MSSNAWIRTPLVAATILIGLVSFPTRQTRLAAASPPLVIASGLDNPRGLAFGPDNSLFVVEAGRGGATPLCAPDPGGPLRCYGPTGGVTRITGVGVQQRVINGLPSLAQTSGESATGPHHIDFGAGGNAWITIGFGGTPETRAPFAAAGINLGTLVRMAPNYSWFYELDLAAYESAANPDGGAIDSNPYGLKILADRGVYTDAGGNALMQVLGNGRISTLAVFPNRLTPGPFGVGMVPMQSVPTSVTVGPDGNYYVGELTGFPFTVGAAQVYRVPAAGGTPVVVATGFTNIIDVAIDRSGRGYVLEYDADGNFAPTGPRENGRLTRIELNGSRTVLASTELVHPGGMTIGPDGAVYLTNRSISAGTGEVLRIEP
jgi:hypothetical protein